MYEFSFPKLENKIIDTGENLSQKTVLYNKK